MVPVKLELLTTEELRNLSEQEKIEGFEDLDREELIQELSDKYEDEASSDSFEEDKRSSLNLKNVSSFTDYRDNSAKVTQLPGVEDLPKKYEETSIHLLYKNSDWGYAFWSVSTLDQNDIAEKNGKIFLGVNFTSLSGEKDYHEVSVSEDDTEWYIVMDNSKKSVYVSLCVEYQEGTNDVLAQSKTLEIPSSYWLDHSDEMKLNDSLFKAYISLITTKTGDVIGNSVVKDILIEYAKGGKA